MGKSHHMRPVNFVNKIVVANDEVIYPVILGLNETNFIFFSILLSNNNEITIKYLGSARDIHGKVETNVTS